MTHDRPTDPSLITSRDVTWLSLALSVVLSFMAVEVVVGFLAHSLALISDAGHMLTDAAALGITISSVRLSRRPASRHWTYGFHRAETLSASLNALALVALAAVIITAAIHRLLHPSLTAGGTVMIVAGVGALVNLAALSLTARSTRSRLDIRAVTAHLRTDIWAFAATFIAGAVIVATSWRRADAVAALVVAVLMLSAAWPVLRDSARVLLEAAPSHVDLALVRDQVLSVSHVLDVHDLHVWVVGSELAALSAHVVVEESCFVDGHAPQILDELQSRISGQFDVEHSTFQIESVQHTEHERGAH